jgi:uncharacterized protein (TIGR04255 family)
MVLNQNQHLDAAPITEALVDVRVKELTDSEVNSFADMPESFTKVYEVSSNIKRQAFRIEADHEGKVDANQAVELFGIRYETADRKRVVQFKKDGFTLSFLYPYSSWDELYDEAKGLFDLYKSKLNLDSSITRIALRYINHIDLPSPCELEDYLTAPPSIPDELPQGLANFLTQNTINMDESGVLARIVQSSSENPNSDLGEDKLSVLLDIDVIKFMDPLLELKDESIWSDFVKLRKIKNDIFYNSITKETEELFK